MNANPPKHAILLMVFIGACSRSIPSPSLASEAPVVPSALPGPQPIAATRAEDWITLRNGSVNTSIRALMPRGENAHAKTIVMLGGICAHAGWVCKSSFEHAGDLHAFLCPQPTGQCGDGTPTWVAMRGGNDTFIDAVVDSATKMYPQAFNFDDAILAGFSRGGWIAAQYAMSHRKYRKLLLSSIEVTLDASKLREQGVERVLLTANDRDGSRQSLQANAKKLSAAGIEARFFGTGGGDDAHGFEPSEAWWKEAFDWFEGDRLEDSLGHGQRDAKHSVDW